MKKFIILMSLILTTSPAFADWTTTKVFDDFDETTYTTSITNDGYNELIVRKIEKQGNLQTQIYIYPNDSYICADPILRGVKYKFDNGKIHTVSMIGSVSRKALFIFEGRTEFINGLNSSDILAIRYTDDCGTSRMMKFNISKNKPYINSK